MRTLVVTVLILCCARAIAQPSPGLDDEPPPSPRFDLARGDALARQARRQEVAGTTLVAARTHRRARSLGLALDGRLRF
jgi:hypothetical protein